MRAFAFVAALTCAAGSIAAQDRDVDLDKQLRSFVQPFLADWCADCHTGEEPEAELDLREAFRKIPGKDRLGLLLDVRDVLKEQEMPPEDEPAPEEADREKMIAWLEAAIAANKKNIDPGRVTMRRLSRVEYRNTIRDLFGITEDVTEGFPADDLGYGFDNNGDSQSVSVLHIEKYAAAARRIAELAITTEDPKNSPKRQFEAEDHKVTGRGNVRGDYVAFSSRGTVTIPVELPRTGDYRVRVHAAGDQAGDEPARLGISIDGKNVATVDVPNRRPKSKTYERRLRLTGGRRRIGVSFVNDYFNRKAKDKSRRDRNLYVDYVEIVGPVDARPTPFAQKWIFANDNGDKNVAKRARPLLVETMRRAWRRPIKGVEAARMARLVRQAVADGDSFEQGMQLGLQAILVSPHFLFRIEPGGLAKAGPEKANASEGLGDYQIASRLSYFLWSSTPDARLLGLAASGRLRDAKVLATEAKRMLGDARADALATNFAGQWLELRNLDEFTPDKKRFPGYTPELREAMRRETEMFFRAILRGDSPVHELLDAKYTFLNESLAKHYGIRGVTGTEMRRARIEDPRRGGLLGHASMLAVTSNPTRTSPVKRGKWILDNILDDPPPPPEPGFDSFKAGADVTVAANMRAQMLAHRASKACSICHRRMDALGLALENYDAIGRWRDKDHGLAIDATGELPGGRKLDGPISLKKELRRGDAFVRCLTKKLFFYAIGREVRGADAVVIDRFVKELGRRPTLTGIVVGVVQMDAFRHRVIVR